MYDSYGKLLGAIVVVRDFQGGFVAVGKCVAYQDAPTVIVEKADGSRIHRRADMATLLTSDPDIVQGLMAPQRPLQTPDNKSSVIQHTLSSGKLMRMCMGCNLHVDEHGNPDEDYYSMKFLTAYYAKPVHERCVHRRAT